MNFFVIHGGPFCIIHKKEKENKNKKMKGKGTKTEKKTNQNHFKSEKTVKKPKA